MTKTYILHVSDQARFVTKLILSDYYYLIGGEHFEV